ncbi:TPR-like protein [Schizopora paradoxa]|uniref:TPR-like protein n=1 Tax=Schizopora paradoxa TaxID=27342 RepID=A0A0H2RUV9_9AGAM|nr:TPR-like protein [Schizopora paradoxa]
MEEDFLTSLRSATKDCADRGLYFASKWRLLLSIPADRRKKRKTSAEHPSMASVSMSTVGGPTDAAEADLEEDEMDELNAGRSYAEAKEFTRASHLLEKCKSAKGRFMHFYFKFLASEKKALRDWHNLDCEAGLNSDNPHQPPAPINTALQEMLQGLINVTDPWLLFMKGIILKRLSRREEAVEAAIRSIGLYPWNWSCWQLLGSCLGDGDELAAIVPLLPLDQAHPLIQLFQVKVLIELHTPQDTELSVCEQLLGPDFFPNSLWIMSMRACTLYHLHDFSNAEIQFDKILELDPYRIDDIDIFSNILYVAENRSKLSKLAHHFLAIDKDRPEVCCLVGNHYSLRSEQEKAIQYFRRATELDQTYLSAWTLMGHEYVEIKNSHAAIESYRRAIDVNRKDYRAWYGLGQAYELLNMHQYSLHYYQRATALRPYDVRIWQAQGMCYEEMMRPLEAIECLKRALLGADPSEIQIKLKLARLYDDIEDREAAVRNHQLVINICVDENRPIHTYARSCVYIARYYMESGGDLILARAYLDRVANSNAEEVNAATELLRKLNSQMTGEVPLETQPASAVTATTISSTASGETSAPPTA